MTGYGGGLFEHHQALLAASAIPPEVARERGYVTVDTKTRLAGVGFADYQQRIPGLLIPIHNELGEVRLHQYRPDSPRSDGKGRQIKYETPAGARLELDVPPRARGRLDDPGVPLWVTEGSRKADAAAAAGLCCIALLGVRGWQGTNPKGGKTALPGWTSVALNGRQVNIAFDSDVMVKHEVQGALAALSDFLEHRGAKVHYAHLPAGQDGAKVGLDDYLAGGGTIQELVRGASTELPSPTLPEADPVGKLIVLEAGTRPDGDPPAPLIEGLMRSGESVVLGAGRAVGKSWWGMDLARMLARGHSRFMGALPVMRHARVLYCHGELDPWGAFERWQRLAGDEPLPTGLLETFERWRLRVVSQRVTTGPAGATVTTEQHDTVLDGRVEATIAELGIDVLIIDPWAVFYAGRENSNDEQEAALDKLRDLQLRYGLTVVILHHFGKATEARDPEDLWRGASRLADWASTRVTLRPHYTDKQAREQGMTRHQARRYADVTILRRSAAPTGDFSIAWNPDTGQWDRWRAPEDAAEERRIQLTPMDVAAKCPPGGWPSVERAAAVFSISKATMRPLLEQAVVRGLLEEFSGARNARGFRPFTSSHDPADDPAARPGVTPLAGWKERHDQGK